MEALIDPVTSPYHPAAEIRAEIAEIEKMPIAKSVQATLEMMRRWAEWQEAQQAKLEG